MFDLKNFVATLTALICFAFPSLPLAETINVRGSTVAVAKIGPWHIAKTTYENGSRLCWAYNFLHQDKRPAFSFHHNLAKEDRSIQVRFDSIGTPKANEEVKLRFSGFEFTLVHPVDKDHRGFFVRSEQEFHMLVNELLALSKKPRKTFTVTDKNGRTYKYRADKLEETLTYITTKCGGK